MNIWSILNIDMWRGRGCFILTIMLFLYIPCPCNTAVMWIVTWTGLRVSFPYNTIVMWIGIGLCVSFPCTTNYACTGLLSFPWIRLLRWLGKINPVIVLMLQLLPLKTRSGWIHTEKIFFSKKVTSMLIYIWWEEGW
jgi:hypothetical protein